MRGRRFKHRKQAQVLEPVREPQAARGTAKPARGGEKKNGKTAAASTARNERGGERAEHKGGSTSTSSTSELRQGKLTFKSSTSRTGTGDGGAGTAWATVQGVDPGKRDRCRPTEVTALDCARALSLLACLRARLLPCLAHFCRATFARARTPASFCLDSRCPDSDF